MALTYIVTKNDIGFNDIQIWKDAEIAARALELLTKRGQSPVLGTVERSAIDKAVGKHFVLPTGQKVTLWDAANALRNAR